MNDELKQVETLFNKSRDLDKKAREANAKCADAEDEIAKQKEMENKAEVALIQMYKKDIKTKEEDIAKLTALQLQLILKNDEAQQEKKRLQDQYKLFKKLSKKRKKWKMKLKSTSKRKAKSNLYKLWRRDRLSFKCKGKPNNHNRYSINCNCFNC